jgi:hypothetical protein
MERMLVVQRDQQIASKDLNNIGLFGRASLDRLVREAVDPGNKFTGFATIESAPAEVTVGAGALWSDGEIYFRNDEGGVTLDLLSHLPTVATTPGAAARAAGPS